MVKGAEKPGKVGKVAKRELLNQVVESLVPLIQEVMISQGQRAPPWD